MWITWICAKKWFIWRMPDGKYQCWCTIFSSWNSLYTFEQGNWPIESTMLRIYVGSLLILYVPNFKGTHWHFEGNLKWGSVSDAALQSLWCVNHSTNQALRVMYENTWYTKVLRRYLIEILAIPGRKERGNDLSVAYPSPVKLEKNEIRWNRPCVTSLEVKIFPKVEWGTQWLSSAWGSHFQNTFK